MKKILICGIGNALVDSEYKVSEEEIKELNLTGGERAAVIAAAAEGYPFPTNLDTDPPVGGLASESQAELLNRALNENMSEDDFQIALHNNNSKRLP